MAEGSVVLMVWRSIVMKAGARQFTIDMTAKVRPLSANSSPITGLSWRGAAPPILSADRKQTRRIAKP